MSSQVPDYSLQLSSEVPINPIYGDNNNKTNCPQDQQTYLRPVEQFYQLLPIGVQPALEPGVSQNAVDEDIPVIESVREKPKRIRTAFTSFQLIQLENEFKRNMYIDRIRRSQIAKRLSLCEKKVKIWFQNRRMKHKKDTGVVEESGTKEIEKSRVKEIAQSFMTFSQDMNSETAEIAKEIEISRVKEIAQSLMISSQDMNSETAGLCSYDTAIHTECTTDSFQVHSEESLDDLNDILEQMQKDTPSFSSNLNDFSDLSPNVNIRAINVHICPTNPTKLSFSYDI